MNLQNCNTKFETLFSEHHKTVRQQEKCVDPWRWRRLCRRRGQKHQRRYGHCYVIERQRGRVYCWNSSYSTPNEMLYKINVYQNFGPLIKFFFSNFRSLWKKTTSRRWTRPNSKKLKIWPIWPFWTKLAFCTTCANAINPWWFTWVECFSSVVL